MSASRPFTLTHFRDWARRLDLDNDQPWKLDPFQAAFIRDVFRGFPICWLVVPEGNGKTTLIAGLALYTIEHKPFAYVAVAASARDQAEWIYRQAEGFVMRNELDDASRSNLHRTETPHRFRCLEGYRRIRHDATNGRIQVFSADDRSGDGAIATDFILDELHRHRDLALYRTWSGKLSKRGGQLIAISTAGEVGGEFEHERTRFRQSAAKITRKGAFVRAESENAVLHDWSLEEGASVDDLKAIKRANPFGAITVNTLRQKRELPGMTPTHWERFTCNRPSRAENAAVMEAEWAEACTDRRIPEGEPIWLGLDVAFKYDTTAAVPFWMPEHEFRLFGAATILVPPRNGNSLDPFLVEAALEQINDLNPIHTVVMDVSHANDLAAWLEKTLGTEVIDRAQTNTLASLDYSRFMEALRKGWLHHSGDVGLTQHVLNGVARVLPGGDTRFDRPHESRTGRESQQRMRVIDALTAASMVHSLAVADFDAEEAEPWVVFA